MPENPISAEQLSAAFRRFATYETRENSSPLYERLSLAVAKDDELLELAAHAMTGQPPPNMLFAAVQVLLTAEPEAPLGAWYPTLANGRSASGDPAPSFRSFALAHRDAVITLVSTHMVQTNEVRRSALLFPAFVEVSREAGGAPLALIEIGPSAGLNLLFDRYQYRYGKFTAGNAASPVILDCEPEGMLPPVEAGFPAVTSRVGIDVRPIDVCDEEDVRWLRALIWPEHDDRRALLDAALAVARADPPRLLGGDVFALLPVEVGAIPPEAAVCLFATFVLNQFSAEMLDRLEHMLADLSRDRDVWMVVLGANQFIGGATGVPEPWTSMWLLQYRDGRRSERHLARCNPHGRRMTWRAPAPG